MTSEVTVNLIFPVEWEDLFEHQESIEMGTCEFDYEDQFGYDYWQEWVSEHERWEYLGVAERHINTSSHNTPGYEGHMLSCVSLAFRVDTSPSSRRTVRRELRISVPPPTKLPLPR